MKNIIIKIAAVLPVIMIMAIPAFAQAAPPATPIDGGLSILLAAGGIYGLKKLRDNNR